MNKLRECRVAVLIWFDGDTGMTISRHYLTGEIMFGDILDTREANILDCASQALDLPTDQIEIVPQEKPEEAILCRKK